MAMNDWQRWLDRQGRRTGRKSGRRRRLFVPRVEELQERCVPALLTVTTFADVIDPNDGVLSLREAIIEANATPGLDTITLAAGTYTLTITGRGENAAATGDLDVTDNLIINGAGSGATIIEAGTTSGAEGNGIDRVLDVLNGAEGLATDLTLNSLTVRNGLDNGADFGGQAVGGGILHRSFGTLALNQVNVSDNTALGSSGANSGNDALGGGIANIEGGTVNISDSTISLNLAVAGSAVEGEGGVAAGGGLFNDGGTVTIDPTTFSGNVAGGGDSLTTTAADVTGGSASGGAIANVNGGSLSITDGTFVNNAVQGGPAVTGLGSTGTATGGEALGGAIYNEVDEFGGDLTILNSTFTNNVAKGGDGIVGGEGFGDSVGGDAEGGAIFHREETAVVSGLVTSDTLFDVMNSTIDSNTARTGSSSETSGSAQGGGIYFEADEYGGGGFLLNNTITRNTAFNDAGLAEGGGVATGNGTTGNLRVANTIIAENLLADANGSTNGISGADVFGSFTSGGNNFIGNGAGATGFTNGVNGDQVGDSRVPLDPKLGPLQANGGPTDTRVPDPGSPVIDAGDNSSATNAGLTTDQRGFNRISGGTVDIGAVEVQQETDLGVDIMGPTGIIKAKKKIAFTIEVTNNGPETVTDVVVTYTLDGTKKKKLKIAGTPTSTHGTCTLNGKREMTCNIGTLGVGETAVISYFIKAKKSMAVTQTATVDSPSTEDPNPANDTDTHVNLAGKPLVVSDAEFAAILEALLRKDD